MNKNSLHKIIDAFVLPKYPWIEGYHIEFYLDAPLEKYNIDYYVKPEEDGLFTVTEEMNEAEKLTDSLFRMLGPEPYQILNEIIFLVKNRQQDY
jgi:hypothetical protein